MGTVTLFEKWITCLLLVAVSTGCRASRTSPPTAMTAAPPTASRPQASHAPPRATAASPIPSADNERPHPPTVTATSRPPSSTPLPTSTPAITSTPHVWRIMPLGDSLTSGNYPGGVHSYRGYLEGLLRRAGYPFDFVGTQSRLAHGGTDPDHEGHSGYTIGPDAAKFCDVCETANLYDHLETYLKTDPDIILLLIGINDLLPLEVRPVEPADAAPKLKRLVERIFQLQPDVYLFVASLAPLAWGNCSDWPEYRAINQTAEALGTADATDHIFFVDMNRQLAANLDPAADFTDSVHWSEGGARKAAQVWFDALVTSGIFALP